MSTTPAHAYRTGGASMSLAQRDLVVLGRIEGSGARATFTWRFGDRGRFLRESTGVLGRSFGCDGVEVWLHDVAGRSRVLELGEDHSARLLSAVLSGQWADPPHDLEVGDAHDTAGGAQQLILALGHRSARLEIDPKTGDLREVDLNLAFRREHWTLKDHLTLGGIRYPRTLVRQGPAGLAETEIPPDPGLWETVSHGVAVAAVNASAEASLALKFTVCAGGDGLRVGLVAGALNSKTFVAP